MNNKKRGSTNKEGLNRIVLNTLNKFKSENNIDNTEKHSLIKFTKDNTALSLYFEKEPAFFCNPEILTKIKKN